MDRTCRRKKALNLQMVRRIVLCGVGCFGDCSGCSRRPPKMNLTPNQGAAPNRPRAFRFESLFISIVLSALYHRRRAVGELPR